MKIRNGFVSNSSSSSFIIAIHNPYERCPACGKQNIEFLDKIEEAHDCNSDNEVDGVGVDHLIYEYKKSEREWGGSYDDVIKEIEDYRGKPDWLVAKISISYHNEKLKSLLNTLVDEGRIKIISGEND